MTNLETPNINNQKPAKKLEELSVEELNQISASQKEFSGILDEENKQLKGLTETLREKLKKFKESSKS
ncbi:MAG TPA: hypothetical protein VIH31_00380 [Candidatus Paceibacterota bacterium]